MDEKFKKPETLYKYVSFKAAEAIISGNSLKFTNPQTFNDPFDCDIAGVYFEINERIDPLVRFEINKMKEKFPADFLTKERLERAYKESVTNKLLKTAITCFSLDGNNDLMWAHYANDLTGVCLVFNNNMDEKKRFIDIDINIEGVVSYDFPDNFNYCENKFLGSYKLFITKAKKWGYEKEYRTVIYNEGTYKFNPLFLSKVIFGLRMNNENKLKLIKACEVPEYGHVKFASAEKVDSRIEYKDVIR